MANHGLGLGGPVADSRAPRPHQRSLRALPSISTSCWKTTDLKRIATRFGIASRDSARPNTRIEGRVNPLHRALHWSRRHRIVALCFVAVVIGYTDRVNISVASVAMRDQFGWSQTTKGVVLASFFVGYMVFMPMAGWLSARFGGHRALGLAVLTWSIFTLLTPIAAFSSLSMLVAARVGMGIGEAAMFPAAYDLFGRWVPDSERTRAVTQLASGMPLGTIAGLAITGWIVATNGWPLAFYAFGLLGLGWTVVWFAGTHNMPEHDPKVTHEKRGLLETGTDARPPDTVVHWRRLLSAPALWAIVVAHFCSNWVLYLLLAWLPSYFRDVQHLSLANAGLFSAAPSLTMAVVLNVAGFATDALIARGVNRTWVRKLSLTAGLLGPAVCMLLVPIVQSSAAALLLLSGAMGTLGFTQGGFAANMIDIAPRQAAIVMGISNTVATIPGIVCVATAGWLIDATGTYSAVFLVAAAISTAGATVYALYADTRPVLAFASA
jgi:MFS transporter, ACS family, solute carrier family 17 (sodium-dependent inorganic phosphate cotransporter), other